MPFVVTCPTCRQPLTVDEASSGTTVACPTCRAPLAVPAAAVPVAPADPFEPPAKDPRRSRRPVQGGGVPVWAMVGALVLLVAGIVVAVALSRSGQQPVAKDEKKGDASATKQPVRPPKKDRGKIVLPQEPPAPKVVTWDDVWKWVKEQSAEMDSEEPAKTEAVIAALTFPDAPNAKSLMSLGLNFSTRPELRRLGLYAWMGRQSRERAIASKEFQDVARDIWSKEKVRAGTILKLATFKDVADPRAWFAIEARTPALNLAPEVRDDVLDIMGADWFVKIK